MAKFSANFWGSDFCSTAGYDQLVKRLKEGKRMCHDFEEYLEKRSRIEREYGESLIRLSEKSGGKDEIGSLRKGWDQLKTETEAIGKLHIGLAQKINDEVLKALKEFKDTQRDVRKKSEDTVKRAAAHKKSCYNSNNRAHSHYDQKCREADKAEEQHNKLQSAPNTKPQDLTKGQKRAETARMGSKNADQLYQESVKNLEEARSLWEREMELLCRQFQELEEQRIAYLRHQIWSLCNLCSQTTVYVDQSCENVRQVLEECNVDTDIDLFVAERTTGTERPAPIPYINYYHPTQSQEPLGRTGGRAEGAIPFREPPQKELPPLPVDEDMVPGDGVYSAIPDDIRVDTGGLMDEGYYATPKSFGKVTALYNYEAQGPQELTLEEGDVISVVAREDDVWWCGKMGDKTGMFPAAYVEPYEDP